MLQNRVNPFGELICTKARGGWLGNRGQLHGKGKTILRPYKHQAWIICQLKFKGRQREIMAPNLWTELFFLDEATAMAAGHRPCFECRFEAAKAFKVAWLTGNPAFGFNNKTPVAKIDAILQAERIGKNGEKISYMAKLTDLPAGVFIEQDGQPCLLAGHAIYKWSPFGYTQISDINLAEKVKVLTPRSMVSAIKCGYCPQIALK